MTVETTVAASRSFFVWWFLHLPAGQCSSPPSPWDCRAAVSRDTRLHQPTGLATEQSRSQSGGLLDLGDSAGTSLPLPDPWRRPSERTTDWRVASIWSEHYWQWTSGAIDCANVSVQKGDTLNIWFKQFACSDSHWLCWKVLTCE